MSTSVESLIDLLERRASVALYPSSCRWCPEFESLPHTAILLNSNAFPATKRHGKTLCLRCDNNELLGVLARRDVQISTIVIIRDGCQEGGNYECCLQDGFFGRLLPVLSDTFELHCDHGDIPLDIPATFDEFKTPDYMEVLIEKSAPISPIRSFSVTCSQTAEAKFMIGRIDVRVVRESIWCDVDRSGLTVIRTGGSAGTAVQHYLEGLGIGKSERERFVLTSRRSDFNIESLLQRAEAEKHVRISLMPMGTNYRRIIEVLENWQGQYPREIYFYHINRYDFEYLRGLSHG